MLEIIQAGGWLMVPIIACSVIAAAIILERLWTLQPKRVLPRQLVSQVRELAQHDQIDAKHLQALHQSSPLGQVLAAGLANRHSSRGIIKESIEDSGRHVVHELERYLNPLATIAEITPLLGLLGTVIGMIKVFAASSGRRQHRRARGRHVRGADYDGRGAERRDPGEDRLSLSSRPHRRARRADGEGDDQVSRFRVRLLAADGLRAPTGCP